jgi:hypothetical protein
MEALGHRVSLTIAETKKRTVFRESTVYEYVAESYDEEGKKHTYWKCIDDDGNDSFFDLSDIISGKVYFLTD